jgi:hypothetical protein
VVDDREFWMLVRQALLMFVDAIERRWLPDVVRTAEARRALRTQA